MRAPGVTYFLPMIADKLCEVLSCRRVPRIYTPLSTPIASVNLPYATTLTYHGICQHNLLFDPSIFITIVASLSPLQASRLRRTTTASSTYSSTSGQHLFSYQYIDNS